MEKLATLADVKNFFEIKGLTAFRKEWEQLSEKDQNDLRVGIGNGTLDY